MVRGAVMKVGPDRLPYVAQPQARRHVTQGDQSLGAWIRQRLEHDAVNQRKDRGRAANAEPEGDDGDRGEARVPGEPAEGQSKVIHCATPPRQGIRKVRKRGARAFAALTLSLLATYAT